MSLLVGGLPGRRHAVDEYHDGDGERDEHEEQQADEHRPAQNGGFRQRLCGPGRRMARIPEIMDQA
jgi:hypothetical protein